MALEAPASRVHHLAGRHGHETQPCQPSGLQGGQGRADALLAPLGGPPARVPRHCRHPREAAKEEAGQVTVSPHPTVTQRRVSVLVTCDVYVTRYQVIQIFNHNHISKHITFEFNG